MEENNMVEQRPKKSGLIVVIILLVLVALGIGGYFCYDMYIANNPKTIKSDNKKQEEKRKKSNNGLVTEESIKELADSEDLYIDTKFNFKHDGWNTFDAVINDNYASLIVEDGQLYLTSESKKSKVSNIDEYVVQIKSSFKGCDDTTSLLVLTGEGNLYEVDIYNRSNADDITIIDGLINNLRNNKDVQLSVHQINSDDVKVLAFTQSTGDDRGFTCGYSDIVVYCDDGTLRSTRDFEKKYDKAIIDSQDGFITEGFIVFVDKTISVDGKNMIKNKDGKDLVITAYFAHTDYSDDSKNIYYILDNNSYLYTLKGWADDFEFKLYSDSKVKQFAKTEKQYSENSDKGEYIINFEDSKYDITIEASWMNNYTE